MKRKSTASRSYEVTLRRDVQQVAQVRVTASSRREAIDVAESVVDNTMWRSEEYLGAHRSEARLTLREKAKRS